MRQRTVIIAGVAGIVVALASAGTALGLAVPVASSTSDVGGCGGAAPKLTVEGTGLGNATPDLLTISVGIDVTDPGAQAALADDNSKASAVTAALKQGGTLDKDVQTSNLSIQPSFNDKGVITGYQVTNELTAKLRNFSSAGSIIDALAGAAGNAVRIDSLTFSVEDTRTIEDQARNQAVHQAVSHAQSMAQSAGERLGQVCSLSDDTPVNSYPQAYQGFASAGASANTVPLQPGSQQVSAQVTIVYALESQH